MKLPYVLILLLAFVSCKKGVKQLTKITGKNIAIDSTIIPATAITNVITPYKEKLTTEMEQTLSYTPKKIIKTDAVMQSSLGNLMADMCFEMAMPIYKEKTKESIDFVLLNYEGIRSSLPAGTIITEDAFKLMPFENELVVTRLTGEKIMELVAYFIDQKKAHPLSKSIALTINEKEYALKIKGKNFDKNKTYDVLTSDYLQGGGDQMNFFKNPVKLTKLDYKLREAIIDYFKKTDTLKTGIDNRVIIK